MWEINIYIPMCCGKTQLERALLLNKTGLKMKGRIAQCTTAHDG